MNLVLILALSIAGAVIAAPTRSINWYVSEGEITQNTALVANHFDALTGAYLCCGFGSVNASGEWKMGTNVTTARLQMAPFKGLPTWMVIGVSNFSVAESNWEKGIAAATSIAAQLSSDGLTGFLVDYEPSTNYTMEHGMAYANFLKALCRSLKPLNVKCGMDIASWGILKQSFWPLYIDAGIDRFTSMTPTYNAFNITENKVFVTDALNILPPGSFAAGIGSTLTDAPSCPMQFGWKNSTFTPFVEWMGSVGVQSIDIWRCDIDRSYLPDPTATFVFDALSHYLTNKLEDDATPTSSSTTDFSGDWISVHVRGPTCNVLDFGAIGDGITNDTLAVQAAINSCSKSNGGITLLPVGHIFLTAALIVPTANNIAVVIDGTLRFSNVTKVWANGAHCLTFLGGNGIALVGSGVVDGQGAIWWPQRTVPNRPGLVLAKSTSNMLIANLTFIDSPNHTLEIYATLAEVLHVTALAPASTAAFPSHNTDAIDIHGDYFYLHECKFSVGDDNVAIHNSHVLVSNCYFGNGHGASIGSLGGDITLQNITVRDTVFDGTVAGARIKIDSTKTSGFLKDIFYTNLTMTNVGETISLCFFYDVDGACNWPGKVPATSDSTLQLSNINFVNITSADAIDVGQITCMKELPCTDIGIHNIVHTGTSKGAWACNNAQVSATGNIPALPSTCRA